MVDRDADKTDGPEWGSTSSDTLHADCEHLDQLVSMLGEDQYICAKRLVLTTDEGIELEITADGGSIGVKKRD